MSKEQQIKELACTICGISKECEVKGHPITTYPVICKGYLESARRVLAAGYRKIDPKSFTCPFENPCEEFKQLEGHNG
jgi:hypothetical protein